MSEILLRWLNDEVRLSKTIVDLEKDFANGFLFGELLAKFDLQPDFESFADNAKIESKLANMTRLEVSLKRLGVKFGSKLANEVMTEKRGSAAKLVLHVRNALETLVKTQADKEASLKGTSKWYTEESKIKLSTGTMSTKGRFEQIERKLFQELLHKDSPRGEDQKKKMLDEDIRVQTDEERRIAQLEEEMRKGQASTRRKQMLQKAEEQKRIQAQFDERMVDSHQRSKMAVAEIKKEKVRARTILKDMKMKKRQEELEEGKIDVQQIDEFERNLKHTSHNVQTDNIFGTDESTDAVSKEKTTNIMDAVEHLKALESRLPAPEEARAAGLKYLQRVKTKKEEEESAVKEREKRRRKVALEQQRAQDEMQDRKREVSIIQTLLQLSREERSVAHALLEVRREKEEIKRDRIIREKQYTAQREVDFEVALKRNAAIAEAEKEAYAADSAIEAERAVVAMNLRRQAKSQKHADFCGGIVNQLLELSVQISDTRWSGNGGGLIDAHRMREWKELFVQGLSFSDSKVPLYNAAEVAVVSTAKPIAAISGDLQISVAPYAHEAEIITQAVNDAEIEDYVSQRGLWEVAVDIPKDPENPGLNRLVSSVQLITEPPAPTPPPPDIPEYPLRLAVVGPPFSGKTMACQTAAARHSLIILRPEDLISRAVSEYEAHPELMYKPEAEVEKEPEKEKKPSKKGEKTRRAEKTKEKAYEGVVDSRSVVVVLGAAAAASLKDGTGVADEVIVKLITLAIKEIEALISKGCESALADSSPVSTPLPIADKTQEPELVLSDGKRDVGGWIIDGYPQTPLQAALLERELTGCQDMPPTKDGEKRERREKGDGERKKKHTLVHGYDKKESKIEGSFSGIDAIIHLNCLDKSILARRATGRRADVETGRIYHLEFDPPPPHTGVYERLVPVTDTDNAAEHLEHRVEAWRVQKNMLSDWLSRYNTWKSVDASVSLESVLENLENIYTDIENAKANRETKEVEVSVVEVEEKEQAADTSADIQLPRGLKLALQDANNSPPNLAGLSLQVSMGFDPDTLGRVMELIASTWKILEKQYFESLAVGLTNLRAERAGAAGYLARVRRNFETFIRRPDQRQLLIEKFEEDFNQFGPELRSDADMKAELHQKTDDLQELLWTETDNKKAEAENERKRTAESTWVDDHAALICQSFVTLMQSELDRYAGDRQVISDYFDTLLGKIGDPGDTFAQNMIDLTGYKPDVEKVLQKVISFDTQEGSDRGDISDRKYGDGPTSRRGKKTTVVAEPKSLPKIVVPNLVQLSSSHVRDSDKEEGEEKNVLTAAPSEEKDTKIEKSKPDRRRGGKTRNTQMGVQIPQSEQATVQRSSIRFGHEENALVKYLGEILNAAIATIPAVPPPLSVRSHANEDSASKVTGDEKKRKGRRGEKEKEKEKEDQHVDGTLSVVFEGDGEDPDGEKKEGELKELRQKQEFALLVETERRAVIVAEDELLKSRITRLHDQAIKTIVDLYNRVENLHDRLDADIGQWYISEMKSIAAVILHIKHQIEKESKLVYEIRLDGDDVIIDEEIATIPPEAPPRPATPVEITNPYVFTIAQLHELAAELKGIAPKGIVALSTLTRVLQRMSAAAAVSGAPGIPAAWANIAQGSGTTMRPPSVAEQSPVPGRQSLSDVLRIAFDVTKIGYVDWRQVVLSLALYPSVLEDGNASLPHQISLPTLAELLSLRESYLAAIEGDPELASSGQIPESLFHLVPLFFEEKDCETFENEAAQSTEKEPEFGEALPPTLKSFSRTTALKDLMFFAFAVPCTLGEEEKTIPLVDIDSFLYYLCNDISGKPGLSKACNLTGPEGLTLTQWYSLLHRGPLRTDSAHPNPRIILDNDPYPKETLQKIFKTLKVPFTEPLKLEQMESIPLGVSFIEDYPLFTLGVPSF